MSQFLLSPRPKQQTPAMPPSHPHTVGAAANPLARYEDEDNDICPVCDGECTCANKPRPVHTPSTSNASPSSIPPSLIASSSTAPPAPVQKFPSLKIRLTIPPSMLGKKQASFDPKTAGPTTSASAVDGGPFTQSHRAVSSQYATVPKKKGRPLKPIPSPRHLGIKSSHDAISFYRPSQAPRKRKPTAPKKTGIPRIPAKLKGKATIVKKSSAPKRKRVESSESSSELSDVENRFHFNNNDDARSVQFPTFVSASALSSTSESDVVSLSGFDTDSSMEAEEENFIVSEESRAEKLRVRRELLGEDGQKRRNPHNNWVIRPRKRSVGLSDAEMDIDSDATEDGDDEEEQEAEEDDDEVDGIPVGSGYIGVATGWSEPEDDHESSFDADLFFANLTDSDEDDERSYPPDEHDERADDGDQSDLDNMSVVDATLAGLILRRDLEHLPFELTEGWDGQVIFSNGLGEGRGLLDVDFEVNSSLVDTSSPSQDSENMGMETDEDAEFDGGGDTTDEELVGDDHLPNERAMRLFNLPFSVSSINPMSTMSPSVSPAPRNRRPLGLQFHQDSPKPADILSGRVFLEDSDNPDEFEDNVNTQSVSSRGNGPRTGHFIPGDTVRAVIDDTHTSVPSPHPRIRGRGRGKSASYLGRTSPRHSHPSRRLSLPPLSQPSFHLLSSSELTTSPELPAHTIDLDDVLDTAFLDSEPSDEPLSSSPTDQSRKHLNLSRWGWGSDTPGSTADFGNVMKSSPLSSMLWQDKDVASSSRHTLPDVPSCPRDGDRTPTNFMAHAQMPPEKEIPTKSRKESRRERKVKQKNMGLGYDRPPHQQHYFRQHHPNLKGRSSGSSQRSHFFNNSPPATNL
ncbi:hypothetical protein B0H15DRAFT_838612 [Mycena belliarum]|uniref:Uncharacterized protein n=1 Tax=Mycena belliarum TaxID=1033014 RepID=A0AAD6U5H9_9AGAR|nr:hypothetical protein B0H15DRAFT_838612 [Mycena belliae]